MREKLMSLEVATEKAEIRQQTGQFFFFCCLVEKL